MRRHFAAIPTAAIMCLALSAAALAAPQPAGQPATEKTVHQLIADLESDAYAVREGAMRQLAAMGNRAAEALAAGAESGKPETAWRATFALREMALLGDNESIDAAERQLRRLTLSKNFAVSDYASDCLADLGSLRRARAVERLQELGAKFNPDVPTMVKLDDAWTGGDEGVRLLRHVAEVQQLTVEPGTQVSDEALATLRKEHPNQSLQVTRYGEAFMGVGTDVENFTDAPGLALTNIVADGPAAKGGLQVGDLITKIDNAPVRDFQQLVKALRGKRVNQVVTVTYLRGGKEAQAKVTLGARPGVQVEKPAETK